MRVPAEPPGNLMCLRVPVRGGEAMPAEGFASAFSRPLAVAVGAGGAPYVADWGTDAIYRITWAAEN